MISFSCLLHFLLWHRGDSITGWHVLLFRTPTKMRSLEGSSHDWPLCIRSSSHSKPVIMVHPYLSDCRDCSISCDNNLLEQSRKKQTLEMCCSPINLSCSLWLTYSLQRPRRLQLCSWVEEDSPCPYELCCLLPRQSGLRHRTSQIQFQTWRVEFSVDITMWNIPKQHCRTCTCGWVAPMSYQTVKPKSTSAFVFVRVG